MATMKYLTFHLMSVFPLFASFHIQTSWLRSFAVDAVGVQTLPDEENQVVSGDPSTTYSEAYDKTVSRDDGGLLNIALLDYTLDTASSGQGPVNTYSFDSTVEAVSVLIDNSGASTSFEFSSSVEFTTNTSFRLEAVMLNLDGLLGDISLWVDDTFMWSALNGIEPIPTPDFLYEGSTNIAL